MKPRWGMLLGLHHWKGAESQTHPVSGFWTILSALGAHPWVCALGWDVILSACCVGLWAAVSNADVESMLKCSVWPWLDDTIEAVKVGAETAQDVAEPYLDAMSDGVEQVQEMIGQLQDGAGPYVRKASRTAKIAVDNTKPYVRPYVESVSDYVGEGFNHAMDAAELHVRPVGKRAKKAMEDAEPYLEPVQEGAARMRQYAGKAMKAVYQQEGDEDSANDEDADESEWVEARRGRRSSPRKRGRPSTNSASEDRRTSSRSRAHHDDRQASQATRKSSRIKILEEAKAEVKAEARRAKRKASVAGGKVESWSRKMPSLDEIPQRVAEGAEAAGLSWALCVLGGLGLASTGVFGAHLTHPSA